MLTKICKGTICYHSFSSENGYIYVFIIKQNYPKTATKTNFFVSNFIWQNQPGTPQVIVLVLIAVFVIIILDWLPNYKGNQRLETTG